ncbi:low temperature requirement protein A [Tabrizicola sp. YIM 78059]|uniref:low temperature requirement protein A n=1 Tax=Tabrizicola sp. YIM 78059 TaxID=2529861 RepID=UPI0010AA7F52|nr:low temperature requirement protein A [Tabrizicola sp. YIM 78059]
MLDIATPFLVASETHRAPPHPEHLLERFGLFTIILLGETAAAAVNALDHGTELHGDTLVVALLGAFLGFLYWVGYFRRARGIAERHVADATAGRNLRLWAYGHIPLYLRIASLRAKAVYLAHHASLEGAAPVGLWPRCSASHDRGHACLAFNLPSKARIRVALLSDRRPGRLGSGRSID